MAINPATPVFGTRSLDNFTAVIDTDIKQAYPNDPTKTVAKAQGVFIAGVLNADGTISPAPSGGAVASNGTGQTTDAAYTDTTGAAAGSLVSLLKGIFRSFFAQATTRVASSAAAGNPAIAKAAAGALRLFWGQNGAAITYLQVYNKATAPVIGTDTPVLTYPIPANAVFNQNLPGNGLQLGNGISFAFTTDAVGTTGSAAAAVTAFNIFTS